MDPESDDWIPLSEREEWQDVEPVPVDPGKVIAIQYKDRHKECIGYFRAIMQMGEKSQRALELTEAVIILNSADYTAWNYRWDVLTSLGSSLAQEQAFTQRIADDNVKNYQLWNHRRKLAQALGQDNAAAELQFAKEALDLDAKNYHAWAHRQYVVQQYGLWQQELEYIAAMLAQDVRNNSAWNQRGTVMQHKAQQLGDDHEALRQLISDEIELVAEHLHKAPRNESPWNYLRGLFTLPGCPRQMMATFPTVPFICQEALNDTDWSCPPALVTLEQYYSSNACVCAGMGDWQQALQAVDKAVECVVASLVADPIHAPYYRLRLLDLGRFKKSALGEVAAEGGGAAATVT